MSSYSFPVGGMLGRPYVLGKWSRLTGPCENGRRPASVGCAQGPKRDIGIASALAAVAGAPPGDSAGPKTANPRSRTDDAVLSVRTRPLLARTTWSALAALANRERAHLQRAVQHARVADARVRHIVVERPVGGNRDARRASSIRARLVGIDDRHD